MRGLGDSSSANSGRSSSKIDEVLAASFLAASFLAASFLAVSLLAASFLAVSLLAASLLAGEVEALRDVLGTAGDLLEVAGCDDLFDASREAGLLLPAGAVSATSLESASNPPSPGEGAAGSSRESQSSSSAVDAVGPGTLTG